MNYTRLWVTSSIIVVIVVASFLMSVPHTNDATLTSMLQSEETDVIPVVTLRDSFKKGVHTLTGSIETPNACTTVTAEATLIKEESSSDVILVAISMPKDSGICLQLPTKANFSTTISAPANIPIKATVNESLATTTVL